MKIYLKIIFFFLIISSMNNFVHAGYNYPYVCNSYSCSSTETKMIEQYGNNDYLLTNINIETINFKSLIDSRLSSYSNLYGNTIIQIGNIVEGGKEITKNFTFNGLMNQGSFVVAGGKTYFNGIDYIFSNFSNVIILFHEKSGLTIGFQRKDKLTDIHPNIESYSNGNFNVKRICSTSKCEKTKNEFISYNSQVNKTLLVGSISNSNNFPWLSVPEKKLNIDTLNAGDSLFFNFGFSDYLDRKKDEIKYNYEIGYQYVGTDKIEQLFSETIYLKKDVNGKYYLHAPGIEDANKVFTVSFSSTGYADKVEITINESMKPTKTGKIHFYFTIKNITSGSELIEQVINSYPLVVIPSNKLGNADVRITSADWSEKKNEIGYNVNDTLGIKINLRDEFGNPHYDYINGYDISFTSGSSTALELSKGYGKFEKNLIGVKSNENPPHNITFTIRSNDYGYHSLRGFSITAKEKVSDIKYKENGNYKTITGLIPQNLYDSKNQLMQIHIKDGGNSDFEIKCTNKQIKINSLCKSDNFSGCNNSKDEIIVFNTEKDNSIKEKAVSIIDKAYNVRSYNFTMNHIDQTPPAIRLYKGNKLLDKAEYEYKAAADFFFEVEEKTPNLCTAGMFIDYSINIGGKVVQKGKFDSSNMERITPKGELVYEKFLGKVDLTKFLSKSGVHDIIITTKDAYGNTTEKKVKITIYPTDEDLFDNGKWVGAIDPNNPNKDKKTFYTFKVSSQGDKYANMVDNYLYTIENLSDKFGNPIYDKKLNFITHDTTSVSGLKGIFLNESKKNGGSALDMYNLNNVFSKEGNFSFNLRSYTPGEYSQYFKAELYGWNDNYTQNTSKRIVFYPNIVGNPNNQFKTPINIEALKSSTIETSNGEVCSNNTIWSETLAGEKLAYLKYRIFLTNDGNLNNITNGKINIDTNSVKDIVEGHNWVENKLKEINSTLLNNNPEKSCIGFKGMITAKSNILKGSDVKTNNLEITYTLKGDSNIAKTITYILDEKQMQGCDIPTLGVKVEGTLQGDGKGELTGQETNFSDISMSEMRGTIRKNAFSLITSMKSGQVLNGIKYVEGNIELGGEINGYETLIVKNGNVLIKEDLNKNGNKLGIIVLKDNYNVNTDHSEKGGNIFVTKNVKIIKGTIYADGTFRSGKDLKGTLYDDSELGERLVLNGTLFTRNTIGGATELIMAGMGGDYLLPGGRKITEYKLASYYDLNFVRKVVFCEGDPEPYAFLIRYDSKIQTNPPKGFTSK